MQAKFSQIAPNTTTLYRPFQERTMQPKFSQIAPNTTTLYRPFKELFHYNINFLISPLNLHVTIHFHSFDILHWKQITFFKVPVISKTASRSNVENHTF